MSITKTHFIKVAAILKASISADDPSDFTLVRDRIAEDFAVYFGEVNPNFNENMFLRACGVGD